jgi:hypothetical protein
VADTRSVEVGASSSGHTESERLRAALSDLLKQVNDFVAEQGEADFYTGPAMAALDRSSGSMREQHERDLGKLLTDEEKTHVTP